MHVSVEYRNAAVRKPEHLVDEGDILVIQYEDHSSSLCMVAQVDAGDLKVIVLGDGNRLTDCTFDPDTPVKEFCERLSNSLIQKVSSISVYPLGTYIMKLTLDQLPMVNWKA